MSSAKPGKVDEIHEASKSSEELASKRQKTVDASATDARSQNWTQYNEGPHQYSQPDISRQAGNNHPDGTYSRDKAPSYPDSMALYSNILPSHIDPRILITGSTNNQLNMSTSSSFQIQNNTPPPSMAYPVAMEPYSTYAFPVMIDQRFNPSREHGRPDPMPSPFSNSPQSGSANGVFPPPYLPHKGPLQDVDRSTSDIFANKRNQLRAEFLSRSNNDTGSSDPNTSDRPDSANTNSSNPESGNDLEDEEDELTGKRRPILKSNEDRRVHHKLVEQERRKTMNKYINRLRELMDIPAPTKGRGLKKSIVLEKACEYVDKIHDYVATLYNANQQLMNALNMRGVTPQMMAQLNIPFVPPPPSHIYPPSNYRAPQYVSSSPISQRPDPHSVRGPIPYPPYFKPEMHGQLINDQPFPPHHLLENNPLVNNNAAPNPFNANLNPQQPPNPNSFNSNAHSSFSEKHTEP